LEVAARGKGPRGKHLSCEKTVAHKKRTYTTKGGIASAWESSTCRLICSRGENGTKKNGTGLKHILGQKAGLLLNGELRCRSGDGKKGARKKNLSSGPHQERGRTQNLRPMLEKEEDTTNSALGKNSYLCFRL